MSRRRRSTTNRALQPSVHWRRIVCEAADWRAPDGSHDPRLRCPSPLDGVSIPYMRSSAPSGQTGPGWRSFDMQLWGKDRERSFPGAKPGRRRRASRRLLARHHWRGGAGVSFRRARARSRQRSPGPGRTGFGLGQHSLLRRPGPDEQSRRGTCKRHRACTRRWPSCAGARARTRRRYGYRGAARRNNRPAAGGAARQLQKGEARPGGRCHRQPLRLRVRP